MFIRTTHRTYKGKRYENYLLVESVHTPKGPRQKVICSLGNLKPRARSEWLKLAHKVEEALAGQPSLLEPDDEEVDAIVEKVRRRKARPRPKASEVVAVRTDAVGTEGHRDAGAVHVGHQMWQRLGLEEILRQQRLSPKVRQIAEVLVLNRLVEPLSEHAMIDWLETVAVADILGEELQELSLSSLYRTLDRLLPAREPIEAALAARERELFNLDTTVLLYDVTSTYFEGLAQANEKARRGYSRDKRPDCKQVVVGLVLTAEGFPLAHEVFEGNRQDTTTLGPMLDALDRRVKLKRGQTVIVDRGMAFQANLAEIRGQGLHYVVAARQGERDAWLSELDDTEGFELVIRKPSPRNPYQKKTRIAVKRVKNSAETLALCISEGREQKDRAIRLRHQQRMQRDLGQLAQRIETGKLSRTEKIYEAIGRLKERYPRVGRYYRIGYDKQQRELNWSVDEPRRQSAEQLDGSYLLKTDRPDPSAEQLWRLYVLLTRVENAFRNLKSPLGERPIYHQKTRRVEAHIFVCVLAYHLLVAIEHTLLQHGEHTSWWSVRRRLNTHKTCNVLLPTDSGETLRIRKGSRPEEEVSRLYKILGVSPQVMKPIKTWSAAGQS